MPSRAFGERYPTCSRPAATRGRHAAARGRGGRARGGAPGLRADARRACISRGDRARVGAELGWPVDPDRTCSSRSAACRRSTSRRSASAREPSSHAPSFFFPQLRGGAGGGVWRPAAPTARPTGMPSRPRSTRDDARDREHAGQPDRLVFLLRTTSTRSRPRSPAPTRCCSRTRRTSASSTTGSTHVSPASHPELHERTLVLRSFSKTHGWPRGASASRSAPPSAIEPMARSARVAGARGRRRRPGRRARGAHGPQDGSRRPAPSCRDAAARDRQPPTPPACCVPSFQRAPRSLGPRSTATRTSSATASHASTASRPFRRHFGARKPHLRIPFGGRRDAREALLERFALIG